jgi:hypothetical protein
MEPIVAERNWHRINEAPKGVGPLLCSADAPNGPFYVGYQGDDGRWFCGSAEAEPTHYCKIPQFDADDDGAAS